MSSTAVNDTTKPRWTLQSSVDLGIANGTFTCNRLAHYRPSRPDEGVIRRAMRRDFRDIIKLMKPGDTCKCECEQEAARRAWGQIIHNDVYSSDFFERGSYTKGIKGYRADGEQIKKLLYLPMMMGDKFKDICADFPRYHFITGEKNHDHPLAHARTIVATRQIFDDLPRGHRDAAPKRYLDLWGNPEANRRASTPNIQIDTIVELITPKDHIRANTKWGNWRDRLGQDVFQGVMRDVVSDAPFQGQLAVLKDRVAAYDGFVSIHTLYYQEPRELVALLAKNRTCTLKALIHRHPHKSGTINGGEQEYVKVKVGERDYVEQTNVQTGEMYAHPDVEWVFQSDSFADQASGHGIAWTVNKACNDSFVVTFAYCPAVQCLMSQKCVQNLPFFQRSAKVVDIIRRDHAVTFNVMGSPVVVDLTQAKTFEKMRMHAAGKARTGAQYKDHLAATKREVKNNGEALDGVNDVALASFYYDFDTDRQAISQVAHDVNWAAGELDDLFRGKPPTGGVANIVDKFLAAAVIGLKPEAGTTKALAVARALQALIRTRGHETS